MLHSQKLSLQPLEDWANAERRRRAQEEAENKELDRAATAQVGRPRKRWCLGSGECDKDGEACNNRNRSAAPIVLAGMVVVSFVLY